MSSFKPKQPLENLTFAGGRRDSAIKAYIATSILDH